MRANSSFTLFVLAVALAASPATVQLRAHSRGRPSRQAQVVPGEVILKFRSGVSARAIAQAMGRLGVLRVSTSESALLERQGLVHAKLPAGVSVSAALSRYAADPEIQSVQPNYVYHTLALPDDELYSQMWALHNSGQMISSNPLYSDSPRPGANPGVSGYDMGLVMAMNPGYTAADAIQATLQGGTAIPALSGKIATGRAVSALGAVSYIAPPTGVTGQ